jgi:general secretion pathway protein G
MFLTFTPRARARRPMGHRTRSGRAAFTLIELMVVMTIISVLISVAVPLYQKSILRSKEAVLRNNLFTLRTVIDEYTYDKQKAPQTLQDLVSDGYLRQIPVDPITGSADSWKLVMEDATNMVNQTEPGIFDVRSGSDKTSLEGSPYSDW